MKVGNRGIYYFILLVGIISSVQMFNATRYLYYHLGVSFIPYISIGFGILLGLCLFLKEREKRGRWQLNISQLSILAMPMLIGCMLCHLFLITRQITWLEWLATIQNLAYIDGVVLLQLLLGMLAGLFMMTSLTKTSHLIAKPRVKDINSYNSTIWSGYRRRIALANLFSLLLLSLFIASFFYLLLQLAPGFHIWNINQNSTLYLIMYSILLVLFPIMLGHYLAEQTYTSRLSNHSRGNSPWRFNWLLFLIVCLPLLLLILIEKLAYFYYLHPFLNYFIEMISLQYGLGFFFPSNMLYELMLGYILTLCWYQEKHHQLKYGSLK